MGVRRRENAQFVKLATLKTNENSQLSLVTKGRCQEMGRRTNVLKTAGINLQLGNLARHSRRKWEKKFSLGLLKVEILSRSS